MHHAHYKDVRNIRLDTPLQQALPPWRSASGSTPQPRSGPDAVPGQAHGQVPPSTRAVPQVPEGALGSLPASQRRLLKAADEEKGPSQNQMGVSTMPSDYWTLPEDEEHKEDEELK